VGFETTILVFERAKTVHALDRAATVIGIRHCITGVIEEVPLNIPRIIHFVEGLKITTQSTSAGIRICYFRYGSHVRYLAFCIYGGVVLYGLFSSPIHSAHIHFYCSCNMIVK
jgi:hypothetical protein